MEYYNPYRDLYKEYASKNQRSLPPWGGTAESTPDNSYREAVNDMGSSKMLARLILNGSIDELILSDRRLELEVMATAIALVMQGNPEKSIVDVKALESANTVQDMIEFIKIAKL